MSARGPAALSLAAAAAVLVAGCGSTPAVTSSPARTPAGVAPALSTSVSSSSGTSWAIVQLGGRATALESFWELFVRPAGGTSWTLVTPAGVASNGGMVMTATGATSLVTGFRPSQKLTFSPLAATTSAGAQWSQNALLSPGFGDVPDALAGRGAGDLIALTDTGAVETSASLGATWARLATQRSLADSAAGRACGVRALTGAAWTPTGLPLVAASCGKPGIAGVLAAAAGSWRLAGPVLPAALSRDTVDVIGLATSGQQTTAVLAASAGPRSWLLAAWSADGGTHWRLSPALAAPAGATTPSVSIWADGSAGLVLRAGTATAATGAIIGWQSAAWHTLPPLPAGTATLAVGPDGQPQALAASGSTMTAWQLATGSSQWAPAQTVRVPVPYGSSG